MAIAARTRPELIVTGQVTATREQRKKADNTVYAHDITVSSAGGSLYVRIWNSADEPTPQVLDNVAWIVLVGESERNGAELTFARQLTADDLDRLVSAAKALDEAPAKTPQPTH